MLNRFVMLILLAFFATSASAQAIPPRQIPTLPRIDVTGVRPGPAPPSWLGQYVWRDRCVDQLGSPFAWSNSFWMDVTCFMMDNYVDDLPYEVDPDGNGVADQTFDEEARHEMCVNLKNQQLALNCPLNSYPAVATTLLTGIPGALELDAHRCMLAQNYSETQSPEQCTDYIRGTISDRCAYIWTPEGQEPVTECFELPFGFTQICFTTPSVLDGSHPNHYDYEQCVSTNQAYSTSILLLDLVPSESLYKKIRQCAKFEQDRARLNCGI
jgi:hypothetical protein